MSILAKKKDHLFRRSSFWSWRVCKQAKLLHLGHRKPARIHWKANAPKTRYCLVQILVQRRNRAIFLRKWTRRGRYSQLRLLSGHVEWIFVHKNWRGGYWQRLVSTRLRYVPHSRSYTRRKASVRVPCQIFKRFTKSISSAISSQQISNKNSESK